MNQWVKWVKAYLVLALGFATVLAFTVLVHPTVSAAQAQLETPQPGSFQSGISLVRGWVCQANRVDIEVVGRGTLPAVYGEPRSDTHAICGDINNGFSLQVNWNELGEGTHTIRALVDGVELGRAQVIVATLGASYLRGVQGDFVVEPFPQNGQQTQLRWEESRQLFVLTNGIPASSGGGNPRTEAKLEDPQPGSFQSGIGLVRGWVCAAGRIDIEIDGRFSLSAVYGELRGDTQTICSDSNNGFSVLVNWNDLGDGTHTVRALVDGIEFGSATFTVVTLGLGSFPRGLVGDFVLNNFPQPSLQTEVRWQESQQNFVIAGARFPGQDPGLCATHSGPVSDGNGGTARITVTNPCLLSGNVALIRVEVPNSASLSEQDHDRDARAATDGAFPLCATDLSIEQGAFNFGPDDIRLIDFNGGEICRTLPRGSSIAALLQVNNLSHLNLNNPFFFDYRGALAVFFSAAAPAGKPILAVSVPELAFDATSPAILQEKSFTIMNTGGGTLQGGMSLIASDSSGNVFTLTPTAIVNVGAGQGQTVTVRFSPISTDLVSSSLRITTNGGARTVALRGQGQSGQARLVVSPTTFEFGNTDVPGTVDRTVTVTNSGTGLLTGRVDIHSGSPFVVLTGSTFSLAANQSQTVTVRFAPIRRGTYTGSADVSSNGGFVTVTLNGTATGPQLSVSDVKIIMGDGPNALRGLEFGNCQSGTKSFTVQNSGEGTLAGTVTTELPFQITNGASFSLQDGQRQKVSVKLTQKPKKGDAYLGIALIISNGGPEGLLLIAGCPKDPFD